MNIAGDGECAELIEDYIKVNNLSCKVTFHRKCLGDKIFEFWKNQDIFINLSEYEGTSLSMLEAMAYGTVPVVTDVSGTDDFIQNDINGYIVETGNIEAIADKIFFLSKNRKLVTKFGRICIEEIKKKCDLNDYVIYVQTLIQGVTT